MHVDEDLSVQWTLANLLAIQTDDRRDAWNAGAARDVAALDFDRILVAADTGGIWMLNRNGDALPVADVDYPDFWCIAAGLYGNDHFYAGGQKLYETDISKSLALLSWREIPVSWAEPEPFGKLFINLPARSIALPSCGRTGRSCSRRRTVSCGRTFLRRRRGHRDV